MIIKLLMDLIYSVISVLTIPINIPDLPSSVINTLNGALTYFRTGFAIISYFFDLNYLFVLLGIILSVEAGIHIYKLIMFIIAKIPMLNVK